VSTARDGQVPANSLLVRALARRRPVARAFHPQFEVRSLKFRPRSGLQGVSMRRTILALSLFLIVVSALATSTFARQTRQDPDVLGALLGEVRGLRTAIEQMSSASARVQLAMGRLQLNEQRITTYMRRMDEIRDRRPAAELDVQKRQREVDAFVDAIRQSGRPASAEVEAELKRVKGDLAEAKAYLLRLQTEEAQLSRDIATEQDRWAEINRTLEELDRVLTRR
jgi:hypothetical protein